MIKRYLLIGISLLLLSINLSAQNIENIFLELPDSLLNNLSLKDRRAILENKKFYPSENTEDEKEVYNLVSLDKSKSFLRVEMSFESGQAAFVVFEIRSFDKKTGDKVVVFSNVGGAHNLYEQNNLKLFDYLNGKLQISKTPYLPVKIGLSDFIKSNTPKNIRKLYGEYSSTWYELGYEQDNITFVLNDNDLYDNNFDSSYVLGNSIEFIWNGINFERNKLSEK